jgi:class 3 adenylate cyclase
VVALFGAPFALDEPLAAAEAAAKEAKAGIEVLCSQLRMQSGLKLRHGVGLASGKATLGLIGPKGRQRYSAIGPLVAEALKKSEDFGA